VAQRRRGILIAGIYYEPEVTGTALNTTGLAEALPDYGWNVTVLTGIPHYPWWRPHPVPPPTPHARVRVIRRSHYVPAKQSVLRRGAYEASWILSALPALLPNRDLDLVVGVTPTLGGAVLAAAAAQRYRVPYVLLVQDLFGRAARQSGIGGAGMVAGPIGGLEIRLAKGAAAVGITAEGFRDYFLEGGIESEKIFRFRNPARLGPAMEDREQVRARLGWAADDFVVLHTGSMGYKQGLENLLGAAQLARENRRFRFVLQGDGNQRQRLEQVAQDLGLPNLFFRPLVPERELPGVLAAADVLLLNQRASVRNMSLPAKLGTYFAAGVPIVAAVAREDETAHEIAQAGAGVRVEPDNPALLLAALKDLAADPRRRAALGDAGRHFAQSHLDPGRAVGAIADVLDRVHAERPAQPEGAGSIAVS
jgi:colanic acid biosynthesis glycosyl transferase WcaI